MVFFTQPANNLCFICDIENLLLKRGVKLFLYKLGTQNMYEEYRNVFIIDLYRYSIILSIELFSTCCHYCAEGDR